MCVPTQEENHTIVTLAEAQEMLSIVFPNGNVIAGYHPNQFSVLGLPSKVLPMNVLIIKVAESQLYGDKQGQRRTHMLVQYNEDTLAYIRLMTEDPSSPLPESAVITFCRDKNSHANFLKNNCEAMITLARRGE